MQFLCATLGFSRLLVVREKAIELVIVFRAAQFQYIVCIIYLPPSTGALEANVTNELVGALDSAAANGIPATANAAIVDTMLVSSQVIHKVITMFLGITSVTLHPLEPGNYLCGIIMKKSHFGCLHPLVTLILTKVQLSKFVQMFAAVIII